MAKKVIGNIPKNVAELVELSKRALKEWNKYPFYYIKWTTPEQFEKSINLFENSFEGRITAKGARSVITSELKTVNTEIDDNLKYVKNYIVDLYSKKDAPAHYPEFGIVKVGSNYMLPRDNDKRLFSIRQLVEAIKHPELANKKYGSEYWEDVLVRFNIAKDSAATKDSASSQYITDRDEQKVLVVQTLNSLIYLIKACYPTNWREELRIWGFQKEKY